MPVGVIILLAVSLLLFLGLGHRALDRLRLTDRQALVMLGAMLLGSFIDIPILRGTWDISLNVGGGLVPVAIAIWLLAGARVPAERTRGLLVALLTGALLFLVTKLFRFEEGQAIIDPTYLFGIAAGAIAYIAGRSRRAAFAGGVLGVFLLDVAHLVEILIRRIPSRVSIGGAGVFDAIVIAGFLALGLAELGGEAFERVTGGPRDQGERPS